MSLSAALRWRYATKKFDPKKIVSETIVDALLEAGNLAATSYGLQPYQFVVVQNQEMQDRLVASSFGQRQVADASHVFVIATRTDVDNNYIDEFIAMTEGQRDLETGTLEQYKEVLMGRLGQLSHEGKMEWAAKQAYIALGTLLATCASLEIDSCPMEGFVPNEYNEILELDSKNLHAAIVLPIGYRAEEDAAQHHTKVRRPLADMTIRI